MGSDTANSNLQSILVMFEMYYQLYGVFSWDACKFSNIFTWKKLENLLIIRFSRCFNIIMFMPAVRSSVCTYNDFIE